MTSFNPGDVVIYNTQEWEVVVTPDKVPLAFVGEELVWALRLPERTILRYFYPTEIQQKED